MHVPATDIFLRPMLTGEGLCHVGFQGTPEDAQNLFVGSADIKKAFIGCGFLGGRRRSSHCPLLSDRKLGIQERRLIEDVLFAILWKDPVPSTLPVGLSWTMFFCQAVTDHCTLAGSSDSSLFVCRDHSASPLLGSKHGMGSVGVRWSYADNVGVLARGANCTNVHLARLLAGGKNASLDVHDKSLASGSADVLG